MLLQEFFEAAGCQIPVCFVRLLRLFLEAMQHKNSIDKLCNIDHPENSLFVSDAYFPHSSPNIVHRLPIVWIAPSLQKIKLLTSSPASGFRKLPQGFQGISTEL